MPCSLCEITCQTDILHCVAKRPPFYFWITHFDFLDFPRYSGYSLQLRWANLWTVDVKFSQDFTYQKSLKLVKFWQSYSEVRRWPFMRDSVHCDQQAWYICSSFVSQTAWLRELLTKSLLYLKENIFMLLCQRLLLLCVLINARLASRHQCTAL